MAADEKPQLNTAENPDLPEETNNEQLELSFPDPDEFPSYDEVDFEEAEAELPVASFDEAAANEDEVGCCVR